MTDFQIIITVALFWSMIFLLCVILEKLNLIPKISNFMSKVYRGYDIETFSGIFTGFSWAFLDGLITGVVMVLIMRLFN